MLMFVFYLRVYPWHCVYDVHCIGKSKCMAKTGDCVVKHLTGFATGMALVVGVYAHTYTQLNLLCDFMYV